MNFTQPTSKAMFLLLMIIGSSLSTSAKPSDYPTITDELGQLLVQNMGSLMNDYSPNNSDYPTFSDEHYKARFLEMSGVIQYRLTPEIKNHIIHRTERYRSSTERTLGLTEMYFPIFEEYLAEKNIPHHIKYLPIVESNLNAVARSHASAVGLWQFIPGTAKLYGLTVNAHLDERSDTHKASKAAATMLANLYKRYGDWPLALAAYNCGPGRVDRYVKGNNKDFWDIRSSLPRETQMYVPYFMAVAYSYEYYHLHELGIKKQHPDLVLTDSIHLEPGYKTLAQLSQYYNINKDTLKRLNPGYIKNYVPSSGNNHVLVLPARIVAKFRNYEAAYARITNMRTDNPIKCIRRVNNEYELRKLMIAHRFSRKDVMFWNGLPSNYNIKKGDVVAIRKYHVPKDAWSKQFIPPTIESISIASLKVVGLDDQQKKAVTAPVYTRIKKSKKLATKTTTIALSATNKNKTTTTVRNSNPYKLSNKMPAVTAQRAQQRDVINKVSQNRTRQRRLRSIGTMPNNSVVAVSATNSTETVTKQQQEQKLALQEIKKQTANLYQKELSATKARVFTTITKEEKQALAYLKTEIKKETAKEAEAIREAEIARQAKLAAAKKAEAIREAEIVRQAKLAAAKKAEAIKEAELARQAKLAAAKEAEAIKEAELARQAKLAAAKEAERVQIQEVTPLNTVNYEYYTVQKNETIWTIQRRYPRVTSRDILLLNNLTTRSILREGMQLKIPVQ